MHYRDGTEAKIGDAVRFKTSKYDGGGKRYEVMREGRLIHITPGSTSCNGVIAGIDIETMGQTVLVWPVKEYVTLGECDRAELPIEGLTT